MKLLLRVAETGSMTQAAEQLEVTPAAVSAAVKRIERGLGVRVFERTTRSIHPTEEGMALLEGSRQVVFKWQETLDRIGEPSDELEGTIRISAPTDTTYQALSECLLELQADHPQLEVVVLASDAIQHLHREAIDVAIRYGPLEDSGLSARKLAEWPVILVASPDYLAAHGTPESLDKLTEHRLITLQIGNTPNKMWTLVREGVAAQLHLEAPLCVDGFLARRWAVEGAGITFKSLFDVVEDLEAGRLVRVLPEYQGQPMPIHAVFPSRRFRTARLRALVTAIERAFDARSNACDRWMGRESNDD